jgi:hypothetical protein
VKELEGYDTRQFSLTSPPIWKTIEDEKKITTFDNAVWRNVDAQEADFSGARMTNMQFPCEMETLDNITYPRGYEVFRLPVINKRLPQQPVQWVKQFKKNILKKPNKTVLLKHVHPSSPHPTCGRWAP